ncbi:MAG: cysteine--tRNA ligase [Patescibacteria group bacterium]|jgi:cysteinyl-tRNA synthetase
MSIHLFNTLGRKKEAFASLVSGKVGMYTCGLTVYGRGHIGNFRAFIVADVLRRMFEANQYVVTHVVNITDVGHLTDDASDGADKLQLASEKTGETAWDIAAKFTALYFDDAKKFNLLTPTVSPKATDHIAEQIAMIQEIEANGYTCNIADGIYFDTSKLSSYGQLSGQSLGEKESGARVSLGEKKNGSDFALWKFSPKGSARHMEWESPWGKGFPGWHIECSAMSAKYLGVPFDVHTGGIDHIAVHHENEIAQTLAAKNCLEANVWVHNEFLQIDGGKMSKSLGNTYTVEDLESHGIHPLSFRLFILGAHYRTPQNFTWDAVAASHTALGNIRDAVRELPKPHGDVDAESMAVFMERVNDDLDTPGALAIFYGVLNDTSMERGTKASTLLKMDEVLGLALEDVLARPVIVPSAIEKMVVDRENARKEKDWKRSDEIRDEIVKLGYIVEDGASGQKIKEVW